MSLKNNLLGTAAAVAVSTAFGAVVVHAQASVDIVLTGATTGIDESIAKSGESALTNDQELDSSGGVATNTTDNQVTVDLVDDNSDDDLLTSDTVLQDDNLISSSSIGNDAETTAEIGTSPTTAGDPVAVGNLQAVEADVTASSDTNNTHSVLIENEGGGVRSFASTSTMDNNDITASATGNLSEARIDVPTSQNVQQQTGAGEASVAIDETLSATGSAVTTDDNDDSEVRADLIVSSAQEIDGVEVGDNLTVSATVSGATTTTRVEGLGDPNGVTGGSITVTESDQSSVAIGNEATNDIVADGNNTDISASAAVANVQSITAAGNTTSILAETTGSEISSVTGVELDGDVTGDIIDSTVSVTANTQSSSATGSDSVQTLTLDGNTLTGEDGGASVGDSDSDSGMQLAADADAVIANVQRTGDPDRGVVTITSNTNENRIMSRAAPADGDVTGSTLTVDGNAQTSSATGQLTSNTMSLTGSAGASDMSSAVASIQELGSNTSVTASTVGEGGIPVLNVVEGDFESSSMSTSDNVVSATAIGNTTTAGGNSLTVEGANITSEGGDASPNIQLGSGLEGATPDTTGSFVTASSQVSEGTITATQISDNDTLNDQNDGFSNTIETQIDDNLGLPNAGDPENPTSVVSDGNLLSVSATANRANNDVSLGGVNTALIEASAALANYQGTSGSVTAEIGVLGSDPEVGAGTPGALNGAGVIVRLDEDDDGAGIYASTVSVSNNLVSGEANGNVVPVVVDENGDVDEGSSFNSVSVEASTVTGLDSANTSSTIANDSAVGPEGADLALGNLQENDATLVSDVAASFAIVDDQGDIDNIVDSSQTVSDNRQESFATANRATNTVDLTATNTDADTALESVQLSNAPVSTDSDMDVVANAGGLRSSLNMDNNENVSVASGNVVSNAVTIDATNANATAQDNAFLGFLSGTVRGNNVLASEQISSASVTASATTDIYNQDISRPSGNAIVDSSVSISGTTLNPQSTIAQATANTTGPGGNSLSLIGTDADDATANMNRTGALVNVQTTTGNPNDDTVTASVDQEISVELDNDGTGSGRNVPVRSSSVLLNGNLSSAFARGNNAVNALTVDGANIDAGDGEDAELTTVVDPPNFIKAAHLLSSIQTNGVSVAATTTQSRVEIDMTTATGNAIDNSTLSVSGNTALTNARGNAVVNTVDSGANSASVDATTALGNRQFNNNEDATISATGATSVGVFATSSGGTNPSAINGSSVSVSNNVSATNAIGNRAENTLSAAGTNITSGDPGGSSGNATVDASGTSGNVAANAGNLLASEQSNNSEIISTNNNNTVTIDATTVTGSGAAALNSTLTASGNAVEARATANLAINNSVRIGGGGTSAVGSTGAVANFQFNNDSGSVSAEASTTTVITLNGADAADALSGSTAEVSGNSTAALGRGNVASNVLNAESTNANTGSSGSSITASSPDSGVLNASFGVFNEQVQQASVGATITGASYEVRATSGSGNALNSTSSNVSGNSISADAFGNISTNSVTLAALNGTGDASSAVFNGQTNSGAISATADENFVGVFSTNGGVSGSSSTVGGNSITANAVGNFSRNTVTRSNR